MTNRQYRRRRVTAQSTWKKSAASIVVAWACRNSCQVSSMCRFGAGGISSALRTRRIVEAPTRWPSSHCDQVCGGHLVALLVASGSRGRDVPWPGRLPRALLAKPGLTSPHASGVAGQVGGNGESRVGGQEDRSAKPGRSAGPQNERRKSSRHSHGRELDRPEAEGKRREAPRDESYQGYHQAGDLGA